MYDSNDRDNWAGIGDIRLGLHPNAAKPIANGQNDGYTYHFER